MASSGPNSPGTISSDSSVGTVSWSNPSNAGASDDSDATATSGSTATTHYLWSVGFGFSIPGGSTIDGILVEIEKQSGSSPFGNIKDSTVRLIIGGSLSGDNKANTGISWPTTDTYTSYGGASDLWGLTPTVSDVNGSDFGIAISGQITISGPASITGSVDHVRITVHYTEAAAGGQPITKRQVGTTHMGGISRFAAGGQGR